MTNQISIFQFQSYYDVRIQLINNEPFFCLKDVCGVLDIKVASPERFQLDSKGITRYVTPTNSGKQEITFINEPNLYRVIFRSNKPEAKQFQDWVFNDVLPTIRKTGSYSVIDKSNYITAKQLNDLKLIVNNISMGYFYEDAFIQGVWKMIRDVTGSDSVQHINKDRLHLITPEIEKMLSVTKMYLELRKNTESEIVKKVFRGHANADVVMFNIKHKHAHLLANLDKYHQLRLDNFSKNYLKTLINKINTLTCART